LWEPPQSRSLTIPPRRTSPLGGKMQGTFKYAGFGAMMSTPDLIRRLTTDDNPLDADAIMASALTASVPGWRLGYFGSSKTWGGRATADIQPSDDDHICVVVVELPIRALDRLSIVEGVYTGRYRFDNVYISEIDEEVLVTRLRRKDREEEPGKSSVKYVARMVKGAWANNIPLDYILDAILGRAGFDHTDLEKIFHEDLYSDEFGDAGMVMREWASARLHVPA